MSRVLWLVRHGERRDEVDPNWAAEAERPHDPPLTDHGRWQAERLGERLQGQDIEAVYASPFVRATETAHLVARTLDRPVFVDHGLSEHLNADWFDVAPSVLTPRTLADRFDTVDPTHSSVLRPNYPETDEEAASRTVRAVRRLLADGPETSLFVGHGLTVASVVAAFTGREEVDTPVAGITRLASYPWGWDVDILADTSHLETAADSDADFDDGEDGADAPE
ncbi:histidine phosphatase family protein [Salinigranum halophilum]|uniref:histidine phosphatase family protein n=1 Tax=Salinigranum halophilum TaxID=2565931 RepID=UPI00115CC3F5|nr:histidine phosphatase family protein [Salinigranum halophilum]